MVHITIYGNSYHLQLHVHIYNNNTRHTHKRDIKVVLKMTSLGHSHFGILFNEIILFSLTLFRDPPQPQSTQVNLI